MALNSANMSRDRLEHLVAAIEEDVRRGLYYGASIRIARNGEIALDAVIGAEDAAGAKPLEPHSIYSIFSITKAFVNVLTLRAVELGRYALTTKVSEVIPEFSGAPRSNATFYHLLTHTAGMPGVWSPKPDMKYVDLFDELLEAVIGHVHGAVEPGTRCDYSPIANHVLLGEALRRTDPKKRAFRDILREDLFEPLKMRDTAVGVRRDLQPRHVVPDMRGTIPIKMLGHTRPGDYGAFEEEHAEMPHVGCIASADNLWRFAEMLRRGGELDGARILSPAIIEAARKNWTGEFYNELYRTVALRAGWEVPRAYMGLGFNVRGDKIVHHQFGTLTSAETFGNYGAGSSVYWIDPKLNMSFVCLTAGVMTQAANIERFQRLSDIAVSAAY